jgi:hypothetical protein
MRGSYLNDPCRELRSGEPDDEPFEPATAAVTHHYTCPGPDIQDRNGLCRTCGFFDEPPYANEGRLIIITSNLGLPLIVRVTEIDDSKQMGWACILGAFKGRWITVTGEKFRQVLQDGDVVEDGESRLRVSAGSLVEINRP